MLGTVSSRFRLRRCHTVGDTPNVSGSVWVKGAGCVRVGHRVSIDGREAPVELYAHAGAELCVGDDVRIGPGASLVAAGLVVVGDRVELGSFCKTLDCNYHPLQGDRNRPPRPMRVVIEHDAVIGKGAILLPGAHVKAGARIPAGAVVSRRGRPVYYPPPSFGGTRDLIGIASRAAKQVVQLARAWKVFGRTAFGKLVFVGRGVHLTNSGTLVLGDRVVFVEGILHTEIVCRPGATLEIGAGSHFGDGTSLDVALSIRIGARCLFGSRVRVSDRDDHGARRIDIGNDVWLAHGVVVKPGITIGDRAVVGAGSVVMKDVPEDHLALGNPARTIPLSMLTHIE